MIAHTDKAGRLIGDPALLRSVLFPYRPDITADMMEEAILDIEEHDLIIRYHSRDQAVIQDLMFWRWQTPHPKEVGTRLPPPEKGSDAARRIKIYSPRRRTPPNLPPERKHLVQTLRDNILAANPGFLFHNNWFYATGEEINKLIDIDEVDPDQVLAVIEFVAGHNFWGRTIFTGRGLRQNFSKIEATISKETEKEFIKWVKKDGT